MEQELTLLYLTMLKREPSFLEKSNYLSDLIDGTITIDGVREEIEGTLEYKKTLDTYYGDVTYDRNMNTIELTNLNENKYDGVYVANGKICVLTGALPYETQRSIITVNYEFDNLGRYDNNVVDGFKYTDFRFFNYDQIGVDITEYKQKLNMYNAIFTKSYTVTNENRVVGITHECMALQQYPYCFLQNIHIENKGSDTIELNLYHVMATGTSLETPEYYSNMEDGVYMFYGKGTDKERKVDLVAKSVYKFSDPNAVTNKGNKMEYNNLMVSLAGNTSFEIKVITGMMSTNDFGEPDRELKRILMNIYDKELRVEHTKRWIDIWNTADIVIQQKLNIASDELESANKSTEMFQRNIKYSLYTIFSLVRDDVNVEINTLNLSVVDTDGEIYWNSELFLIPILLLMRPRCAKVLLDYRYKQLENAKNLALAYGNKGSYYPYRGDVVYYKDVYWQSGSPVYAFNSALVAISAWNYFRVTVDKYWLHEKGFAIIQNCVRFFQSLFDENYNLKSVYTMNNKTEENNSLTRYLIITVLRYYREACYEIAFNVPLDIEELYQHVILYLMDMKESDVLNTAIEIPTKLEVRLEDGDVSFYDQTTGDFIGKRFGQFSNRQMRVSATVDYELNISGNVFIKLYDNANNEITEYEGTAMYSGEYGFTDGTVIIRGGNISSYSNIQMKDYVFGKNAFVSTGEKTVHKIIESDVDNRIIESHIILMNYYSKLFLNNYICMNKTDIIKDNLLYYSMKNSNNTTLLNRLFQSNLECLLAQDVGLTTEKEYYMNAFEATMSEIFDSTEMTQPFGNHRYHSLLIFNVLTSMAKLKIRGMISDRRFYVDDFGIDSVTGNILPKYWYKMIINYNNKTTNILNTI